ncbi:hypothetical protein [Pseudobacter ginsenosidimutans]|jgi:hypothetical protein|uniref:Uncharacterized protein n=1 Tax=Pseudobacter ginsenosidimutans TaxID=661488 RepID=A0A4Q7MTB9_9BACT|nr:hypothetical protein [Pseudobacter ginsenosidimutans]QEC41369.1 hypothetical protein FSB84_06540 [Pseudobacter ginsenosidimutans]RZS71857.1 hypothetical protein EV199_3770 [Pseudobacter ginsenosidimutans]
MLQKRFVMTGAFLLCWCCTLLAQQLKLGSNPSALMKSALLELSSANQGLLFPRLNDTISINSSNPPDGMVIYFIPTRQLMLRANGVWVPMVSGTVTATNAWNINGNTNGALRILGTLDNFDLPIYTNNAERMRISSAGNVAIGATSFDGTNPEKLLVNAGSTSSVNAIYAKGSVNNYFQINIQNLGNGAKSSSDLVATANNGTETTNFVDLGINGSGWQQSSQSPISTGLANDCYLLGAGQDLYIANNNATKSTIFLTGGTLAANEAMRITAAGNLAIGTTTTNAKADVNGTYKLGAKGNINKNQISFASTIPATTSIGGATLVILGLVYTPAALDLTFNIPAANAPTSTQATVAVSFGADLPASVSVAFARVQLNTGVYQVKMRLLNSGTTTAGTFATAVPVYFTITEF